MSYTESLLWSISLSANGIWLGSHVIRWSGDDPRRLGRATLGLFLLVIVLSVGWFMLPPSALLTLDKTVCKLINACLWWCLLKLAEVAPSPWGNGPRRHKARTR